MNYENFWMNWKEHIQKHCKFNSKNQTTSINLEKEENKMSEVLL